MAIRGSKRTKKIFTLAQQQLFVKKWWPTLFSYINRRKNSLILNGQLQPTPLSQKFTVKVNYRLGSRPKVFVDGINKDDRPPHTFEDGSLCLYHHKGDGAFKYNMNMAIHLIPLICHWLFCYEQWLVNPDAGWIGDEYPHSVSDRKAA